MKNIFKKTAQAIIFGSLGIVMFSGVSFAYIDTGTVNIIIQAIAGVVVACGVTVGVYWKKIKAYFMDKKIKNMEKRLEKQAEKQENTKA